MQLKGGVEVVLVPSAEESGAGDGIRERIRYYLERLEELEFGSQEALCLGMSDEGACKVLHQIEQEVSAIEYAVADLIRQLCTIH